MRIKIRWLSAVLICIFLFTQCFCASAESVDDSAVTTYEASEQPSKETITHSEEAANDTSYDPEPTPTPTPSPSPTPSPTPEGSTPVDDPGISETEEPDPGSEPTPEPGDEPGIIETEEPAPTEENNPEATPDPDVTPDPDATPDPNQTPDPDAEPTPTPTPEPTLEPGEDQNPEDIDTGAVIEDVERLQYSYWMGAIPTDARGMAIPIVYQFNYPETICYVNGTPRSVKSSGCGATSISMVIAYLTGNTEQTPYTLFCKAYDNGMYHGAGLSHETLSWLCSCYGVHTRWISNSASAVRQALMEGKPVVAHMGPGAFTNMGHYIVLRGLTENGMVLLNDPVSPTKTGMAWPMETLLMQMRNSTAFMICWTDGAARGVSNEESKPETLPVRQPLLQTLLNDLQARASQGAEDISYADENVEYTPDEAGETETQVVSSLVEDTDPADGSLSGCLARVQVNEGPVTVEQTGLAERPEEAIQEEEPTEVADVPGEREASAEIEPPNPDQQTNDIQEDTEKSEAEPVMPDEMDTQEDALRGCLARLQNLEAQAETDDKQTPDDVSGSDEALSGESDDAQPAVDPVGGETAQSVIPDELTATEGALRGCLMRLQNLDGEATAPEQPMAEKDSAGDAAVEKPQGSGAETEKSTETQEPESAKPTRSVPESGDGAAGDKAPAEAKEAPAKSLVDSSVPRSSSLRGCLKRLRNASTAQATEEPSTEKAEPESPVEVAEEGRDPKRLEDLERLDSLADTEPVQDALRGCFVRIKKQHKD